MNRKVNPLVVLFMLLLLTAIFVAVRTEAQDLTPGGEITNGYFVNLNEYFRIGTVIPVPGQVSIVVLRTDGLATPAQVHEVAWTISQITINPTPIPITDGFVGYIGKIDRRISISDEALGRIGSSFFGEGLKLPERVTRFLGGVIDMTGAVVEGLLNFTDARDKSFFIITPDPALGPPAPGIGASIDSDVVPLLEQ